MSTLKEKMKQLSPARRRKVESRAAELIAEELSLRDLRQALKLTQDQLADSLGISQDGISRLEKRSDVRLSTLRNYIEAMGGRLELIAEFPKRPRVVLSGLISAETQPAKRRK
jgi:DNA-binding XRE family transcriptional regulator